MDEIQALIDQMARQRDAKLAEAAQFDSAIKALQTKIIIADSTPVSQDYAGLGIVEASRRWLQEVGGNKTTREIADAIRQRGLTTKSKDFIPTVYATLRNASKDFAREGDSWLLKKSRGGSH